MAPMPEQSMQPVVEHHPSDPLLDETCASSASTEPGIPPPSISIPPPTMMPLTTAAILSQRRRRKSSTSLKRSASTPNVRGHHNSDAGMTLAEKRRNKLGYHRTSVACGHCRRRKIRCLLAPDDPQNRCANCIRLKKECNFFPVDQQPQLERRPRHHSRADTKDSTSSGSSPALAGGHMLDHTEHFSPYPQIPLSAHSFGPATTSAASMNGGLVSPLTRAPLDTRAFDFPPHPPHGTWGSPFGDNGPISASHSSPGDGAQPYWGRHSDSPMTPGFSPPVSGPTSAINSASDGRSSFTSFAPSSRRESAWSMPTRSMSFGVVEDLPMSYQNNYHPQPINTDFRRRASEMHPPSLMNSANSSNASISEAHLTPLSAPVASPPANHWNISPAWSVPSNVSKPLDYSGWYTEPGLAKVQEEEFGPHFGGEPTILYAGGEHH